MSFYIQRDGQPQQYSIEALSEMVKNGQLRADECVFDGRTQQWVGATQVAELADAAGCPTGGTPNIAAAKPGAKKRSNQSSARPPGSCQP